MLHKLWVRNLIIVCVMVVSVFLLLYFQQVAVPIMIALAIGYVGDPVIDKFEEWKIKRTWGIVILCTLIVMVLAGMMLYVVPKLVSQLNDLIATLPGYWEKLSKELLPYLTQYAETHPEEITEAKAAALAWLQENAGILLKNIASSLAVSFKSVGSFLANILGLIIIPVLAFYFLRDFDILKGQALELVPVKRKAYVANLFRDLDQALGNFIKGQLLVALILSIIYSIGLTIAGCPASLLIGIIAGFSNLIPYLGIALGFVPAVLLTYLTGNPMWQVITAGVTFIVGQMLEGMVITPKVVGESVGLHPVVVLVSLMIGGSYFGFVGMILALPVCAVGMVLLRRGYRYYVNSILYHEGESMHLPNENEAPDGV